MKKRKSNILTIAEKGFIVLISEIILILGLVGTLYFIIRLNTGMALNLAIITGIFMWINKSFRK